MGVGHLQPFESSTPVADSLDNGAVALIKIVSGGQTGVDRGALDAALAGEFPCGGWCPADRAAEDGPVPTRYPLTPMARGGYRERTRQNVLDSDGTAILFHGVLGGGTLLTLNLCKREGKPHLVIDASKASESEAAVEIARFVGEHNIRALNVAGPRASGWRQGHGFAVGTVAELIKRCQARGGQRSPKIAWTRLTILTKYTILQSTLPYTLRAFRVYESLFVSFEPNQPASPA